MKRKWDSSVFAKFHFIYFLSTVSNNMSLEYYFVLSTTIIFEKSIVIVNNFSLLLEWLYCQFVWVSICDANIHSAETAVEYSATIEGRLSHLRSQMSPLHYTGFGRTERVNWVIFLETRSKISTQLNFVTIANSVKYF